MPDDIERLRASRGDEQVTFADIADHLHDFVDRNPADRDAVQRLAAFLTAVEHTDHEHEASPTRGMG
jgi:hypothetical protein